MVDVAQAALEPSDAEAAIMDAVRQSALCNRIYRSEGDLWTDTPINLSKFVRFLAIASQPMEHRDGCPSGDFGPCDCAAQPPAAPVETAIMEATAAQHTIPRMEGRPARFTRNGKLEICQCSDCRALQRSSAGSEPAGWAEEDYQRARDCMIGILRGNAWTIRDGKMSSEFDNAFQHAVGILALTARRPHTEPQTLSKMLTMLAILDAAGGQTEASDSKWCWLNWFCEDAEPADTFNQAVDAKLIRVTHDSRFDSSTVYLTEAGRAACSVTRPVRGGV